MEPSELAILSIIFPDTLQASVGLSVRGKTTVSRTSGVVAGVEWGTDFGPIATLYCNVLKCFIRRCSNRKQATGLNKVFVVEDSNAKQNEPRASSFL